MMQERRFSIAGRTTSDQGARKVNRKHAGTLSVLLAATTCSSTLAEEYITYVGAIDVGHPLGRIVADPVRSKVYGITAEGDIVFIDRNSWSVENVVSTSRLLRDIDIHPSNDYLSVLDNVTGEYWDQPAAVFILNYDLETQELSGILLAQAPFYQMAFGPTDRIVGVEVNQFVSVHLVDSTTGGWIDSVSAGTYSSTEWTGPNFFITNADGTRVYRTELASSPNDLQMIDSSTDDLSLIDTREIGTGFGSEPVFLNSTETSLYAGSTRLDPNNLDLVLGVFPESIYAATGDDTLAIGLDSVYDPAWGTNLQAMPVSNNMMVFGEGEQYLYSFDTSTEQLHVMTVGPKPTCAGDANGDGLVDPLDSGFVLARLGCSVDSGDPDCDIADQNGDGLVDPLDIGFVLARFGDCE